MNQYIGTKIINAEEMTRGGYNEFRGWKLPEDENGADVGYRVVDKLSGHISWLPEDEFNRIYNLTDGLTFGLAIEAMKKGHKVARAGWNGKGMWVSMTDGRVLDLAKDDIWTQNVKDIALENGGIVEIRPYTVMKTADNALQIGWLASQSDMLSDDWEIIE